MAPKRPHLADPPCDSSSSGEEESEEITNKEEEEQIKPTAQSEEEESEEEEEEEEGGGDDDEEEEEENNTAAVAKTRTPHPRQSSSESEDGNTKKTSSDFTLNPTASKPKGDSTKSKKPTSKSAVAVVSKPKAKLPASESGKKKEKVESQRKKAKVSQEEKKSTGAVVRVWSEEDEIVILKGLIDYNKSKTGAANGAADMGEFPDFIKKSLSIDFTKAQLKDKVRKMKYKYKDNAEKVENGKDPNFSTSHHEKVFVISKKIWGGEARKLEIAMKEVLSTSVGKEEFWSMYPLLKESLDMESSMKESQRRFLMDNMRLVESSKLREMEQKWNKWRADQVALYLNKVGLIQEQTQLLLDAMEST